jgi:hypothetical protein
MPLANSVAKGYTMHIFANYNNPSGATTWRTQRSGGDVLVLPFVASGTFVDYGYYFTAVSDGVSNWYVTNGF